MDRSSTERVKLGTVLTTVLHAAMTHPHPRLGWKPGASMANFIAALEGMGVDFSRVELPNEVRWTE